MSAMAMLAVVAGVGWMALAGAVIAALRLRRRLDLVGDAAHELRGPLATVSLVVNSLRREPDGPTRALPFETELDRMRAGLADLDAARAGTRAPARPVVVPVERILRGAADGWRPIAWTRGRGLRVRCEAGGASVLADRGRISQALGNLVANAVEHGSGPVELHAARIGQQAVRVEVRDSGTSYRGGGSQRSTGDRGRGLGIAARAVEEAGGRLTVEHRPEGTVAAVELPLVEAPESSGASITALQPERGHAVEPDQHPAPAPERHLAAVEPLAPLAPVIALPLRRR